MTSGFETPNRNKDKHETEEIDFDVIYQIHQKEQHQKHRILDLLHQFQTLELNFQKLTTLKDRIMEH